MKKQLHLSDIFSKLFRSSIFWGLVVILLFGITMYVPTVITVSNSATSEELPIYSVETNKKVVALTFDAAWGNEDISKILNILKEHDVKATFFMTGDWVTAYPEDVKAIAVAGHDLGNHSDTHKHMTGLDKQPLIDEINNVHEKVKELTGQDMFLFRAPYGDYNNDVITNARDLGYYTIQWDVDSLDWKDHGINAIVKRVCDNKSLQNGSIILMHNGSKYTKDALEKVIVELKNQGYEFVTLSELIIKDNYRIDHTGRQIVNK